jgi:hypothetical protein
LYIELPLIYISAAFSAACFSDSARSMRFCWDSFAWRASAVMRDRLAADLLFFAGFCSVDSLSADSLSPAAARGYSFLQVLQVPPRLGRLASHSQHAKQAEQEGQLPAMQPHVQSIIQR